MRYCLLLLTLFVGGLSSTAVAQDHSFNLKLKDFSIAIQAQSPIQVSIRVNGPQVKDASVFLVANPLRLAIDLPGAHAGKFPVRSLSEFPIVSALRIGTHPDKARMVFDINLPEEPQINQQTSNEVLEVLLSAPPSPTVTPVSPTATTAAQPSVVEPKIATHLPSIAQTVVSTVAASPTEIHQTAVVPNLTPAPSLSPSPRPTASATHTATHTPLATLTPTRKVTSTPSPRPETPTPPPTIAKLEPSLTPTILPSIAQASDAIEELTLQAINFDALADKTPIVKFSLSAGSQFNLVRQDEKSFVLTIPNCRLKSPALKLPQFPPQEFSGLNLVQANSDGKSIKILLSVEKDYKIASVTHENEIWVRTAPK